VEDAKHLVDLNEESKHSIEAIADQIEETVKIKSKKNQGNRHQISRMSEIRHNWLPILKADFTIILERMVQWDWS
jgi:hypothetical protein